MYRKLCIFKIQFYAPMLFIRFILLNNTAGSKYAHISPESNLKFVNYIQTPKKLGGGG